MPRVWYADAAKSHNAAHLAAGGPYQDKIKALFSKYPNLRNRDWKVPKGYECWSYIGKLVLLELHEGADAQQTTFQDLDHLRQWFHDEPAAHDRKRLYVVDSIHPEAVALIGNHFGIDPRLFMRQQRTALWEFGQTKGNTPCLPSCHDRSYSFTVEFCELRWFHDKIPGPSIRCIENSRHINVSKCNGEFDQCGIVHRKASFWYKSTAAGGWDALLVVDPPFEQVLLGRATSAQPAYLRNEPYQGGYQDFIQYADISEAEHTPGPLRTSILDDICYYWTNHGRHVGTVDNPAIASVFLFKIIASNYMLLTEYLDGLANEISFKLSRAFEDMDAKTLERDWNDLQSWIPRAAEYANIVDRVLDYQTILNIGGNDNWTNCIADFKLIQQNLIKIRGRCDGFVTAFMGLASIVGNRQNLQEAKSVHILTVLGTFFIPLSFCATLFSMSDIYRPGASHFSTYLASAIPLAFVVSVMAVLYDVRHKWQRT